MNDDHEMKERAKKLIESFPEEELDPELKPWLSTIEGLGWPALRHPLVYAVPYHDLENHRLNQYFKYKKEHLEKSREESNFSKFIFLHKRPYRLNAFDEVECELDDSQYWEILSQVWIDTENFWQNEDSWKSFWVSTRPNRETVMDEDEKKALSDLPETLTIYRGFTHDESMLGLSWTIDEKKAEWFARRFSTSERDMNHPPKIASTTIDKSIVYAFFAGRGESEIVVDPDRFENAVSVREIKK